MVFEAEVVPDAEGERADLKSTSYPCNPAVCTQVPATRGLTTPEIAALASLVEAVPQGECLAKPNPVCDPCLIQELVIGERRYRGRFCDPLRSR